MGAMVCYDDMCSALNSTHPNFVPRHTRCCAFRLPQMGAMVCYDLLVAPLFPQQLQRLFPARHPRRLPHLPPQHPLKQHAQHQQQEEDKQLEREQQQTPGQQPAQAKSSGGSTASGRHNRGASPAAVAAAATQLLQQVAAAANGGSGSEAHQLDAASRRQALRLKLQRILIAALAVLLYVKARSWLAGDQVGLVLSRDEGWSCSLVTLASLSSQT